MKKYKRMSGTILMGSAMLISGCTRTRNMMGTEYQKKFVYNSKTYFSQVWAVSDGDEFRVSGKLRLKTTGGNTPGYVEVALLNRSGSIIDSRKIAYYPRELSGRRNHREARFTARFDEAPPPGTVIRLKNVE